MRNDEWEKLEGRFRRAAEQFCLRVIREVITHTPGESLIKDLTDLADAAALPSYEEFAKMQRRNRQVIESVVAKEFLRLSRQFKTPRAFVSSAIKTISFLADLTLYEGPPGSFRIPNFDPEVISTTSYALYVAWRPDSLVVIPDTRHRLLKIAAIEPEFLRVVSAREFEEFVAYLCELMGYKVELLQQTRDWGADVLAWHGGPFKSKILTAIQVKRYAGHRKVTLKNVYELHGAVSHYNANLGQVVTTSAFTKPAMEFAKKQDINLVDMQKLHRELMRLVGK